MIGHIKSIHTTFTIQHGFFPSISVDSMPSFDTVKYLGLAFDMRLTWKQYIRSKKTNPKFSLAPLKHYIIIITVGRIKNQT